MMIIHRLHHLISVARNQRKRVSVAKMITIRRRKIPKVKMNQSAEDYPEGNPRSTSRDPATVLTVHDPTNPLRRRKRTMTQRVVVIIKGQSSNVEDPKSTMIRTTVTVVVGHQFPVGTPNCSYTIRRTRIMKVVIDVVVVVIELLP